MGLFSFLEDVFQGDEKPYGGIFGFLRQAGETVINPVSKTLNDAVALAEVIGGDVEAAKRRLQPGQGIGHQGGVLGGREAQDSALDFQDIKKVVGTGLNIGSNIAAPTRAFSMTGNLAQRAAKGAVFGTGIGAVGGAGQQIADTGRIDPKALLFQATAGGVLGGAAPVAGAALRPRAPVTQAGSIGLNINYLDDLAKASTPGDVKKILLKNGVSELEADSIANPIALTKDTNAISKILDTNVAPQTPTQKAIQDVTDPVGKQRGFLETVKTSETTPPKLQQAVEEVSPQTYTQKRNPELITKARDALDNNYDETVERLKTADNLTDEDVVAGELLTQRLTQEGKTSDALDIVERLDEKLRDSGRTVQAASVWSRLSPEGVLLHATREVRKARNKVSRTFKKGVEAEQPTAQEIQKAVDGPIRVNKQAVQQTVKEISEGGDELTTGAKVAKRVEKEVTPQVKKKADTLVNELTKKIKQESLEPKTKVKKSPLQTIKEVFERHPEAKEAYPEAQAILREKFADNPQALKALDKFFESELNLPVASTTVDRAIREQLSKNSVKISEVVYKSWANQKQSVDDIAKALTKEGFDEPSAKIMAKEVTDRLSTQVAQAKQKVLERMAKEAPKKAQSTYMEKISKLSNVGVLDNKDYLDLARAKLDLPNLTPEIASDISALSQKLQGMADGPEKAAVVQEIRDKINEAIPRTLRGTLGEIAGAPRAALATADLSAPLRQGGVLGSRFRKEFKEAFKAQVKFFGSEDSYTKAMTEIAQRENFGLMNKAKLAVTGTDAFVGREEQFASQLLESKALKKVGVGHAVAASDRAYTGFLTKLRADTFDTIMKDLKASGIDPNTLNPKQLEDIGRFINTASGRGSLGSLEGHAKTLSTALFSPRLWKSRLDMLNPVYYKKLDPIARKYALQSAGSFASIATAVLGLASLAGASVEIDPRSSDFGKIKVGNTRFDILGGFQQNIRVAAQLATGEKKNPRTGRVNKLEGGIASLSRLDILDQFVEGKANPVISAGRKILSGKDASGQDVDPLKTLGNLFVPLSVQSTIETAKDTGSLSKAVLAAVPGTFGVGVQTYGGKNTAVLSDKQKGTIKLLKDQGVAGDVIKASEDLFKTLKVAPTDRTGTSEDINKALAKNDIAKAKQLADDHNKLVLESLKPWLEENKGRELPQVVYKSLVQSLIDLTDQSISNRLRGIVENPSKYELNLVPQR